MAENSFNLLVIDDMVNIHEDFKRILSPEKRPAKKELELIQSYLFGTEIVPPSTGEFSLDFAFQGEEGLHMIEEGLASAKRYAIIFVDMIMPPGINGIKTIKQIFKFDKDAQVVLCSAYSSFTWQDTLEVVGGGDRLHKLDKPFNPSDLLNLTHALTDKWKHLQRKVPQSLWPAAKEVDNLNKKASGLHQAQK